MVNITSRDLSFTYDEHNQVLEHLNLTIPAGKFSLLIGPTGCGKSTLLKILAGLYPKYAGKVSGHIELAGLKTAMMFQKASEQFTMATPRQEIIFALENMQMNKQDYAQRLQLAVEFTGIATLLDQKIITMSGGEQQKVALAVLVAMDVDVLLLDEPFASCDPQARNFLITKLAHLRDQGKTIILSDHVLSGYETICDEIFQFNKHAITQLTPEKRQLLLKENNQKEHYSFNLPPASEPAFSLTNATITQNRLLLNQASLNIYRGKTTLITGTNGIGKTSLFKALTKMLPYGGSLTYRGQEISKLKQRKYLLDVAQIFQTATDQFLNVTVADELELSKKSRKNKFFTDDKITQLLTYLDLADRLDQVVYSLSGGQQKKLQILLMLIAGHDVLLIDEPLSGLDHDSVDKIGHLLKESQKQTGQTLLIISHELAGLANWCDYHLVFANQQLTYVKN